MDDPACILPGAAVPRAPDRAEAFTPKSARHSAHGLLGPSSTRISGTEAHSHPAGRNPGKNLPWGKGIDGGHAPPGGSSSREALGSYSPAFRGSMELHVVVCGSRHYQPPFPSELLVSGPTRLPNPLVAMTVQGLVEPAINAEFDTPAPPFSAPPWPTFGNGEGLSPPPPSSDPRPSPSRDQKGAPLTEPLLFPVPGGEFQDHFRSVVPQRPRGGSLSPNMGFAPRCRLSS